MDSGNILIIAAILFILMILITLILILMTFKKRKDPGSLLLNGKNCIMERREYDLYNTIKSLIDNDKYCIFCAVPFSYIFNPPLANHDSKASTPLDNLIADFVICGKNSLKPQAVILLDFSPNSLSLIVSDICIINMPNREFYTKKEVEGMLKEYVSPSFTS